MASLYISEYQSQPIIRNGQMGGVALEPAIAVQKVALTGTSAQSSAFNAKTKFVRLHTDAICSILFGADPTAAATSPRMAANTTEYFGVNAGDKVAGITNS